MVGQMKLGGGHSSLPLSNEMHFIITLKKSQKDISCSMVICASELVDSVLKCIIAIKLMCKWKLMLTLQ